MRSIGTFLLLALTLASLVVGAGQLGLFSGQTPDGLGVREARLKAPAQTPNSVSSQAGLYAGQVAVENIAGFSWQGDAGGFGFSCVVEEAQLNLRRMRRIYGKMHAVPVRAGTSALCTAVRNLN